MTPIINPNAAALNYLKTHRVMTLATVGAEGVRATAVFYAHYNFDLYFLSAPHTRHIQNINSNPAIAATIQEDYKDWHKIKGIQLEGIVEELQGAARLLAISLFAKRMPSISKPIPVIQNALSKVNWYCLKPTRLYFIDNSQGFGHRDEVDLML